jgi:transposase
MAYREVTMLELKEVLRLWLAGAGKKPIAAQLGLDVKTVRRYLRAAEECGLRPGPQLLIDEQLAQVVAALRSPVERPHGETWELCLREREFIAQHLAQRLKLSKVQRLLARRGVAVPYPTLHRFAVAELEFGRAATTVPVADCGPGEEVQLDTGWMTLLEPDLFGKRRRFRAWIFTAVRSRHRFAYVCFEETTGTAIAACEAAWEFFGGVFRVLVVDNTKSIVQTADPLAPRITPAFLEYAQARGFHIDTARVRSPRDKARVERAVQPVRDDCFAGERLYSLEQAQEHAQRWCIEEYGRRRHTRTQRMPLEQFQAEERPALLPAPHERYDVPLWCEPLIARDQCAQVAKALYSLPTRFVGKRLRARADRSTVRFYDGAVLVKTHARQLPGGKSIDASDYPEHKTAYALRDVDFLEQQARKHGEAVGHFAHALLDGPLPWTRMRRVYRLLGLAKRYGDARLEAACATALAVEMIDVHRLERMLQLSPPPTPTPPRASPKVIPLARFLRPPSQYALPLASREAEKPEEKT